MHNNPRKSLLRWSEFRKGSTTIPFEVISKEPSSLPAVEIIRNQSRYGRSLKRIGDVVFSLLVLTLGSPIFILIAILVKLSSPGSIFYIQKRVGRNYREFGCIKFRTMYKDADELLPNLLEKYPLMRKEFEKDFKLRRDPRITKLGRFLRRSSLDELPQFFNVLKGEMSVVGPRPIVSAEINKYSLFMEEVISVRPGLTGLWQVSGRNNLSYKKRVQLDLVYARNRNFILDLEIIILTLGVLLFPMDRGAF
ncbi:sugar transferase [Prochlorococcus marinus]|uniref:Galactosyl-1-phosphate transferase n=1 Tax=Prochlorococcus marinus XMU1408 TaxID=2213228 RepID=A0A318R269_PROMR|nr:sugar transferase [Prochlorococcus marinus]MBW3042496.1 galactosyl-1-phosphate transferase [Prochlorococcus marinus str. XMU1408]PYE01227.1 galactosyl-1-phosphate transferase [Prochlorococcus marinus XMU1408]